jgi:hypothetical protein
MLRAPLEKRDKPCFGTANAERVEDMENAPNRSFLSRFALNAIWECIERGGDHSLGEDGSGSSALDGREVAR